MRCTMRFMLWPLPCLALLMLLVEPAWGSEESDEQILKAAGIGTDDAALLDYVRQLKESGSRRGAIKAMIRRLGDDAFEVREKASADLVAQGRPALAFLKQAVNDADLEVVRRAEKCIRQIEQGRQSSPAAAVRMLALRKPAGVSEVLLGYLPLAEDEVLADQIRAVLAATAKRDVHELTAALSDKAGVRRGSAAEALCRGGVLEQKAAVLPLLQDPEPAVRLRVALALAPLQEKAAIPALIELLALLPADQLWPAEELLLRLAEPQAPLVPLGRDQASRQKCRDAWADWWRRHGDRLDLARLTESSPVLGYTLVVLLDRGEVLELDRDNKPRLHFKGIQFPLDVQLLPGNRLLAAEQQGNRVSERDLQGKLLWEKAVAGPLMAQRLPNGNTFIANPQEIIEVNRAGKVVFSFQPPDGDGIMRAARLPNGDFALVTTTQQYQRFDAAGKKLSAFHVQIATSGGRLDVQPNGNVLIPQMRENKVVEYDAAGKVVGTLTVEQPIAAVRLPNGHTLVTSMSERRAVEYDRAGKEVWQYKADTRVTRAYRR